MVQKRTSELLAKTLAGLDRDKSRVSPSNPIIREIQNDLRAVAEKLLTGKQAADAQLITRTRKGAAFLLDDALSRHLVKEIPKMVARSVRFDVITVRRTVPELVAGYLREAAQAYIFGLNSASVALCRAALEAGLKDRVPQVLAPSGTLKHLLKAAESSKLLPRTEQGLANEFRLRQGEYCMAPAVTPTLRLRSSSRPDVS